MNYPFDEDEYEEEETLGMSFLQDEREEDLEERKRGNNADR